VCYDLCKMGEQVSNKDAFGAQYLTEFKVGDLVSWRKLNSPIEYGYIVKIYSERLEHEREFIFAKVRKPDGTFEPFMLSHIQKES